MYKKLKDFFEKAPIYGCFSFPKKDLDIFFSSHLTFRIEIPCPKCREEKTFLFIEKNVCNERGEISCYSIETKDWPDRPICKYPFVVTCFYECAKCNTSKLITVRFSIENDELDNEHVLAQKIGEYPRPLLNYDKSLDKLFKNHKILFHNALKCMRDGLGVGAFAYLRQPLEGCIETLLEEVRKQADEGKDTDTVKRIDDLKRAHGENKIELAKKALPPYLQLDGMNPLGTLYQVCSAGLHHYTDEECLGKANDVYSCLTFLAGNLADHKKQRERYRTTIASLTAAKK